MANTLGTPGYIGQVTKMDKTTAADGTLFDSIHQQLLNNDAFLNQQVQSVLQSIPSGVMDYVAALTTGSIPIGGIGYANPGSSVNTVFLGQLNAILNGYKLSVKGANSDGSTSVVLSSPPSFGTRNDLVFLEAWFDATSGVLNWRIRTVAGVDFSLYPQGLGTRGNSMIPPVSAQGANSVPVVTTASWSNPANFFCNGKSEDGSVNTQVNKGLGDSGLYVAGYGDANSKTVLGTADGYVYAIPIFRVRRRNSGGYRQDNLNGARDYVLTNVTSNINNADGTVAVADSSKFKVGDRVTTNNSGTGAVGSTHSIIAIPNATTVQLDSPVYPASSVAYGTSWGASPNDMRLISDRPDGLFSNIIDANDIIDLRHQVSLTGFNYQQLLEANFDKLLRGELQTKDKVTMKKERFGLSPAPLGLQSQLMPVTVKGNDGVSRDLTNLLGQFNAKTVSSSIASGSDIPTKAVAFTANKYYLLITRWLSGTTDNINQLRVYSAGTNLAVATVINSNPSHCTLATYAKFSPTVSDTVPLSWRNNVANSTYYHDSTLWIEVDKATYDLIDVDPNWTGDNLVGKFPYVSSYPNVVENLFNKDTRTIGYGVSTSTGILYSNTSYDTTDFIPVTGGQLYYQSHVLFGAWYDSSKNFISDNVSLTTNKVTAPSNASFVRISIRNTDVNAFQFVKGDQPSPVYAPFGRWLLPYDYANGDVPTRIDTYFGGGRTYLSDAQTTETVTDVVEVLRTPQRHINVTQATEGHWSANDTIKVSSVDGVVMGVVDSDTALAKVTVSSGTGLSVVPVDDVSKFTVNDTVTIGDYTGIIYTSRTITAIDTTNKTVTLNSAIDVWNGTYTMYETTTSSSVPVTTATGLAGTWSGLGTKTATFTITTKPTTDTDSIKIQYSVVYPAGKGIQQVPYDVLEAKVNGEKLVKASDGIVHVKANFVGKVLGNTDLASHISYRNAGNANATYLNTLVTPLNFALNLGEMRAQADYSNISSLDNAMSTTNAIGNGNMAQMAFSFDIIRAITDKLGEGVFADCVTLADKVAKAKTLIYSLTASWYGYGSSPSGNKAYLTVWRVDQSAWGNTSVPSNTASSPSKIALSANYWGSYTNSIDSNGFVYYLAYADPSDGTAASTINTDYVELELQINLAETGYDVLIPDNNFPTMGSNILSRNQAYPVDTTGFLLSGDGYMSVGASISVDNTQPPVRGFSSALKVMTTSSPSSQGVLVSNLLALANTYYTASMWFKGTSGKTYTLYLRDFTNSVLTSTTITATGDWQYVTQTVKTGANAVTDLRFLIINPVAGVDTFWITGIKVEQSSIATPWTAGRKKSRVLNFLGKVAGSTFENPNRFLPQGASSFPTNPSLGTESTNYVGLDMPDGNLRTTSSSSTGLYSQHMFEFDLSHLGMSLTELKNALRNIIVNWTGYGSGDNSGVLTYGATLSVWNASASAWANNPYSADSAPQVHSWNANSANYITTSQKVYVLVYSTYPASATNPSNIYTDYISLQVTLADYVDYVPVPPVKVRKETKEVKLAYPMKSNRFGTNGDLDLTYRFVPYQGFDELVTNTLSNRDAYKQVSDIKLLVSTIGTGAVVAGLEKLHQFVANLPQFALGEESKYVGNKNKPIISLDPKQVGFRLSSNNDYFNPLTSLLLQYTADNLNVSNVMDTSTTKAYRGVALGQGSTREIDLTTDFTNLGLNNDNKFAVIYHIVSYNGEPILVVYQTQIINNKLWLGVSRGSTTAYRLQGRPLVRGGN